MDSADLLQLVYHLSKFNCLNISYLRSFCSKGKQNVGQNWRTEFWGEKPSQDIFLNFPKDFNKIYPAISGPRNYADKKGENNEAIECLDDLREK